MTGGIAQDIKAKSHKCSYFVWEVFILAPENLLLCCITQMKINENRKLF